MGYRRLFIFVEGEDDRRFFDAVIKPLFFDNYDWIEIRTYAGMKKEKRDSFIKSIRAMGADYIMVADINRSPCVTHKKEKFTTHAHHIEPERIAVVIKEIEGWYLGGAEEAFLAKNKIRFKGSTDDLTKEQFNILTPTKYDSRIFFMAEMLKNFSVEKARENNVSFNYFLRKFG
ncbi:MAG: hypothetical protein KAU14_03540 [Thermoplasmata archaeon]|nr:hypothetical protein [Thermoplasmata archaeon]